MAIATSFIRSFLEKWETRQLVGYIPCNPKNYISGPTDGYKPIGASGVTIGTGLDLGQQTRLDLIRMGVSENLIDKFRPYLGKRTFNALHALEASPLRITDDECEELDTAVHGEYILRAERKFNACSSLVFSEIPKEAQAAIVSMVYQLGSPGSKISGVWRLICGGNWKTAGSSLIADKSRYRLRRIDEGKLLSQIGV